MTDTQIYKLVKQFRTAIENARNDDNFHGDDFDGWGSRSLSDIYQTIFKYIR